MRLLRDHSLKNLNTFGVDIKAKLFAEVFAEDDLIQLLSDHSVKHERKFVLGGGSNTLFTKYFDGVIIQISITGINVIEDNDQKVIIEAGSGVVWDELVKFCVDKNYFGIENLTLIPGTVGAAPIQNIGAYGQELTDAFVSLNCVVIQNGEKKTFVKEDCKFSYRTSIFKKDLKDQVIITSVKFEFSKSFKPLITYKALRDYLSEKEIVNPNVNEIREAVAEIRRSKLPDPAKIGNAGSFFKNPEVNSEILEKLKSEFPDIKSFPSENDKIKISAGWLIEKCGWKGRRIGDVGTSPDHALVICNYGNATGAEILEFAIRIKEEVANKFGILLQEEVNIL